LSCRHSEGKRSSVDISDAIQGLLRSRGGRKTAFLGKKNRIYHNEYRNPNQISRVMHFLKKYKKRFINKERY
jgi:hypothetical protein